MCVSVDGAVAESSLQAGRGGAEEAGRGRPRRDYNIDYTCFIMLRVVASHLNYITAHPRMPATPDTCNYQDEHYYSITRSLSLSLLSRSVIVGVCGYDAEVVGVS